VIAAGREFRSPPRSPTIEVISVLEMRHSRALHSAIDSSCRHHAFSRLVTLGLGLVATGCAEELGPIPMPVARVRGLVTEGQYPVSGGWIEFIPVDGTIGNPRSARLHDDGSFQVDKAAVGINLVRIVNGRFRSLAAAQLFTPTTSPIRRRILPHPVDTPLRIDLVEEAIQYQRSQASAGGKGSGSMRPGTSL
jgi:hypothetical protein